MDLSQVESPNSELLEEMRNVGKVEYHNRVFG